MIATVSRTMSHVDLVWRAHRSDVRVDSQIDIRLGDKQGQVSQQLHYTFADRSQKRLHLRGPASVVSPRVNQGSLDSNGPGDWFVNLPVEPTKEAIVVVTYSFPIVAPAGEEPGRVQVPLLWPDGVLSSENRLRILRDPAASNHWLPSLDAGVWQELPTELIPGETTLPLLVARASGINVPLALKLRNVEAGMPSMPTVWSDRALIQVKSTDSAHFYRVRFHLVKWLSPTVDLELPAGVEGVEAWVGGKRLETRDGGPDASGRILHAPLPLWREPDRLIVEVRYQLGAGRAAGSAGWIARLQPPLPTGRFVVKEVRWQASLPARNVPLAAGDAVVDEQWGVQNLLAHPSGAYSTSELEKWIVSGQDLERHEDANKDWDMSGAWITARQTGLSPLRLMMVPQLVWLMAVSLTVLLAGLLLSSHGTPGSRNTPCALDDLAHDHRSLPVAPDHRADSRGSASRPGGVVLVHWAAVVASLALPTAIAAHARFQPRAFCASADQLDRRQRQRQ